MNTANPADHPPGTRFLVYAPDQMQPVIDAMARQAAPLLAGHAKIAVIGILRRGAPLADRVVASLRKQFNLPQPLRLDLKVKRYADDLTLLNPQTQLTEQPGQEGIDEFEALVLQDEDADLRGRHRGPEHCFLIAHFHRVVC